MRQIIPLCNLLLLSVLSFGQTTANFENFTLMPDSFLNGSEGVDGYESGNVFLPNDYNEEWDSWVKWSISNVTDNTTPGFFNQYSSIAGSGVDASENYAVCFAGSPVVINMTEEGRGVIDGFYLSNSTYAYYSMRDGDAFAKKFGGVTGEDEDYFLLTVHRWWKGIIQPDSVNVYLADYRFDSSEEDYILDGWQWVDLAPLGGNADSIQFTLRSSDVGQFGINTPTYFCIDNFITFDMLILDSDDISSKLSIDVFPNPAQSFVKVEVEFLEQLSLYDIGGNLITRTFGNSEIDISNLTEGTYLLHVTTREGTAVKQLIKH